MKSLSEASVDWHTKAFTAINIVMEGYFRQEMLTIARNSAN